MANLTSVLKIGNSVAYAFGAGGFGTFQIAEIMTAKQATDGIVANKAAILSYFQSKYNTPPTVSIVDGVLQTPYGTPDSRVLWNTKASDGTDAPMILNGVDIQQFGDIQETIVAGATVDIQGGGHFNTTDTNMTCYADRIIVHSPEVIEDSGPSIAAKTTRSSKRGYLTVDTATDVSTTLWTMSAGESWFVDGIVTVINSDGTKAGRVDFKARFKRTAAGVSTLVSGGTPASSDLGDFGGAAPAVTLALAAAPNGNDIVLLTPHKSATYTYGFKLSAQVQQF